MKTDSTENAPRSDLDRVLAEEPTEERDHLEEAWRKAGPEARNAFPNPARIDATEASLEAAITRPGVYAPPRPRVSPRSVLRILAPVAAAAVFIAVVVLIFMLRERSYVAPVAARAAFDLPDGSQVELNHGSRLTYRPSLSGDRILTLEGEAYFDVVPTEDAFRITTFNGQVDVLGTQFNVRAWAGGIDRATIVTLDAGRLRLAHRDHPLAAVILSPGETRSILGGRAQPSDVEEGASVTATAWRQGDLIFHDARLDVALQDVERRFAIEIRLSAAVHADRRISIGFRSPENAESLVNDLAQAIGLRYRPTSTGFELYELPAE